MGYVDCLNPDKQCVNRFTWAGVSGTGLSRQIDCQYLPYKSQGHLWDTLYLWPKYEVMYNRYTYKQSLE